MPAGACHRLLQDDRVGLGDAEGVGAADRGKPRAQAELVEQALGQPFQLVGAHRKAVALRAEIIEGGLQPLERPRGVGDVGGVIVDEIAGQAVDVADAHRPAFQFEAALDQLAGAGADHVAR